MLSLEQKMSVAQTAHSQFEQAYQLVAAINGPLARNEARDVARELLRDGVNQRHRAEQAQGLRSRLNELEQRLREQQDAERQLAEFCKRRVNVTISTIWKRCIRSWKRASRRWPTASPMLRSSAWRCVRSWSNCSRVPRR